MMQELDAIKCHQNFFTNLHLQCYDFLPGMIFARDVNHHYVYTNARNALGIGAKSIASVTGKHAAEVSDLPDELIKQMLQNDMEVMRTGKAKVFEEYFYDASGTLKTATFKKAPVYNTEGEIIGIMGIGISPTGAFTKTCQEEDAPQMLSARQIECLELIAMGRTYKEAAYYLNLSERTIRFHVNNMKKMLGLYSRSQLVNYYYSTVNTSVMD